MTAELILPSSLADLKKLNGNIDEAALCLQRIADQRSHMKDIFAQIKEDFQIAPKHANNLAKVRYKNNFIEVRAEQEEFEALYEALNLATNHE